MNPRIGSGLKHIRRLLEEKAVEPVRNRRDGTRNGARNVLPEGTWETRDRERTPAERKTMEGRLWKTPREAVEDGSLRRQRYESVRKAGAEGQRVDLAGNQRSVGTPVRGRQESAAQVVKAVDGRSEVQRASTRMGSANCRVEGRRQIPSRNGIDLATGTAFKKALEDGAEHRKQVTPQHLRMGRGRGLTGTGKPGTARHGLRHASGGRREVV